MKSFKAPIIVFAFVCLLVAGPATVAAQKAQLTDIVVTNTRDDLLVYLTIEGCFTTEIEQAIMSGAPTTFLIHVTLSRSRSLWFNEKIADITLEHTIKYNVLKKEFTVTRTEKPDTVLVTHSFSEAKKAMANVDSLVVAPLSRLERGQNYHIRCKAELEKVTLPLYLHYVLFFVSYWNFETDWYAINFYF
ncbi:MAG: DUF4390 domain-containing protein [Desulfatibacillaceae bacterium]|nr:DUF4390 domain-containing protein [Desulfatibacillaceae bacterium]